jgi:hypothetical protein
MVEIQLYPRCRVCFEIVTLTVDPEDVRKYESREILYVQDAFPYLSAGERELLISGTCDPCFQEMFPEDDEW